ncbi:MAG: SH3 domain-containing C40 family peptidase [Mobilitalea sp.]
MKILKIASYTLIGALAFAGKAVSAEASEEPVAGITLALDEFYTTADPSNLNTVQSILDEIKVHNQLAFAKVSSYVNIRSKASEEGEILGKLYDDAAATIIKEKDGWYQIKSGSVKGYIKAEFLVTGDKAVEVAKSTGTKTAVVNTTTLKVRKKASLESEVITLIPIGDEYNVVSEKEGWAKIALEDDKYGYVSTDYVKLATVYEEAISIEEEQERLEEEAAAQNSSGTNSGSNSGSNSSSNNNQSSNSNPATSSGSSLGSKIASYAVQFVGNPYVWGGTSLTNGADCSGFAKSVFAHFGISIPRTSRAQANSGDRISMGQLQPGDLVFYSRNGTINHVAIYIGNGKVISASSPSTGIRISNYNYRTPVKAVRYN